MTNLALYFSILVTEYHEIFVCVRRTAEGKLEFLKYCPNRYFDSPSCFEFYKAFGQKDFNHMAYRLKGETNSDAKCTFYTWRELLRVFLKGLNPFTFEEKLPYSKRFKMYMTVEHIEELREEYNKSSNDSYHNNKQKEKEEIFREQRKLMKLHNKYLKEKRLKLKERMGKRQCLKKRLKRLGKENVEENGSKKNLNIGKKERNGNRKFLKSVEENNKKQSKN